MEVFGALIRELGLPVTAYGLAKARTGSMYVGTCYLHVCIDRAHIGTCYLRSVHRKSAHMDVLSA